MKVSRSSSTIEKTLAFGFIFVFLIFAIFFTYTNIEEYEKSYKNQRLEYTKQLGYEICQLIEKHIDVSARLSNALTENVIAYAVVHLEDGSLLARTELNALPVGVFQKAEAEALKADFLKLINFKDPSETMSFAEAVFPFVTSERFKYVLRVGFLRNTEEEHISRLRFRNILVFSLILMVILAFWAIKKAGSPSLRYTLVTSVSLVFLMLFLAGSTLFRDWYAKAWSKSFITEKCLNITQMLVPASKSILENNDDSAFKESVKFLNKQENFGYAAVIKDESFVYHTNPAFINTIANDANFIKSFGSDYPSVYKLENDDAYQVILPVLNGSNRIGTILTCWRSDVGMESVASLRNKISMLFVFAYIVLFLLIQLFVNEVPAAAQVAKNNFLMVASDAKSSVPLNKTLKTNVVVYFSGINEAMDEVSSGKLPLNALTDSAKKCHSVVETILVQYEKATITSMPDGILIEFSSLDEAKQLYDAVSFARTLIDELNDIDSFVFSPKITIKSEKVFESDLDKKESKLVLGTGLIDYRTIAKVQNRTDLIVDDFTYGLLKDVMNFEKLEVVSPGLLNINLYALNNKKTISEIVAQFKSSSDWTKLLILRILINEKTFDTSILSDWLKDENSPVKDSLIKLIELKS